MSVVEKLYSLVNCDVFVVEILHIIVHVEHVVDDAAVDGLFEEVLGFLDHVVAANDAFRVGIADELINQTLSAKVLLHFCGIFECLQLFAIVVGIFEAELSYSAFHHTLCIIWSKSCCVFGNNS